MSSKIYLQSGHQNLIAHSSSSVLMSHARHTASRQIPTKIFRNNELAGEKLEFFKLGTLKKITNEF